MKKNMQVFVACAVGAFVGALVALEIARYLWWVGLLVGGLTGYLTYEVKAVGRAIKAGFYKVFDWKAPPLFWSALGWRLLFAALMWFALVVVVLIPLYLLSALAPRGFLVGLAVCTCMWGFTVLPMLSLSLGAKEHERKGSVALSKELCYYFALPLIVFWHIPRGLWYGSKFLFQHAPAICKALFVKFPVLLARFVRFVFLAIHSERRVLCGVDAMLGAAVGYFAGSALIGAVAGGILGVINYAVITERVLKPRGLVRS
jgi:hypothetical protein